MSAHPVKWSAPAPLWPDILTGPAAPRGQFGVPAILRFDSDSFMDQFLAVLERSPGEIADFLALPETWQEPAPAPAALSLVEPLHLESKLARRLRRLRQSEQRFGMARLMKPAAGAKPLKLYQAAHQRHYLVAASLVCGPNGLTDHRIDSAHQEVAGFVVRRLLPKGGVNPREELPSSDPAGWEEHALVAAQDGFAWCSAEEIPGAGYKKLAPGEELLPLFPVHYLEDDGRRRRVLAGVIPVAKRDKYLGAAAAPSSGAAGGATGPRPKTARVVLFRSQVAEPWKSLIERGEGVRDVLQDRSDLQSGEEIKPKDAAALLKTTREQVQVVSWYILLDFARYLRKYLPGVWEAVRDPEKGGEALSGRGEKNLFLALDTTTLPGIEGELLAGTPPSTRVAASLREALRLVLDEKLGWETALESITEPYDRNAPLQKWPDFLFPLAEPGKFMKVAIPDPAGASAFQELAAEDGVDEELLMDTELELSRGSGSDLVTSLENIDRLVALVARALPAQAAVTVPPIPLAAAKVMDQREGWFLLRCVYERPNCGPLHPAQISDPTVPFQMAGFFDPDAPARPIRIGLPLDTSPGGLRKFDKNTAFMISDVLCGQIKRVKGLTFGNLVRSVLPWPFHKDLPGAEGGPCRKGNDSFGMICSLSLPIITLCAFILLTIIVALLDIIFRWLPFFIVCFPVPGLKGKKGSG